MKILVTGGASGLGEAITRKLAAIEGAEVIFTYAASEQKAKMLSAIYKNTKAVKCDYTNAEEVERLMDLIETENIDILVNNAHTTPITKNHFHKLEADIFSKGFLYNLLPTICITQAAIQVFRKKKYGRIVTVLSASLLNKPPMGYSEYTAAKAYLHSLSKSWAAENAAFNITSNCVSPGFMQTELTADTDERVIEEMQNKHPLKKLLSTDEVSEVIAFLCTSTQQLNGVNIPVNAADNII
jgi:NAD(P)-dependent dehydrogenase (short-subunit alcohol dehydrogenase family)